MLINVVETAYFEFAYSTEEILVNVYVWTSGVGIIYVRSRKLRLRAIVI